MSLKKFVLSETIEEGFDARIIPSYSISIFSFVEFSRVHDEVNVVIMRIEKYTPFASKRV